MPNIMKTIYIHLISECVCVYLILNPQFMPFFKEDFSFGIPLSFQLMPKRYENKDLACASRRRKFSDLSRIMKKKQS